MGSSVVVVVVMLVAIIVAFVGAIAGAITLVHMGSLLTLMVVVVVGQCYCHHLSPVAVSVKVRV